MEESFERYKKLGESPKEIQLNPVLRVNILKISDKELINRLTKKGVKLKKIPYLEHGYEIKKSEFSIGASIEYLLGYLYLQEAASQLPVQILNPKTGEKILDMAAAPGGKTTHLAMLMKNQDLLVALDKGSRVKKLKNNLERLGVENTIVYKKDARFILDFNLTFDKILLDAPCSGNFVVDENWYKNEKNTQLQKELLEAAAKVLKKGGELLYSTCSLEPEENELIIQYAIDNLNLELLDIDCLGDEGLTDIFGEKLHASIKKCRRLWPWKTNTQGFFIAKLRKC